ncbi:MAG: PadR family transcriptional regulator, partial [Anaerolineae bacterium]
MLTQNDLLVLSLLLERPMHGYEISQAIKAGEIEVWFEISTAAIYYSLNKLRRGGMIAEARSRGNVGEKTIYHV